MKLFPKDNVAGSLIST